MRVRSIGYEFTANRPLMLNNDIPSVTFRGALGYSLAQMLAWEPGLEFADKIKIYLDLFNPNFSGKTDNYKHIQPFTVRGNFINEERTVFMLEVVLFGEAVEHEIFWDHWIELTAIRGVGKRNDLCRVKKVYSEEIEPYMPRGSNLLVDFQTSTRIYARGTPLHDEIPFWALFARLYDRLNELMSNYSNEMLCDNLEMSEAEIKNSAYYINSEIISGGKFQARRISGRTGDQMSLNGFSGKMLYSGDFEMLAPVLSYLPWTGVGKSCIFGCGWCVLQIINSLSD